MIALGRPFAACQHDENLLILAAQPDPRGAARYSVHRVRAD